MPRTVSGGERALYHALYPARHALSSSDEFARACGLPAAPVDELMAFHLVFGKTVPDISLNAVANLGYAEGRWLKPVLQRPVSGGPKRDLALVGVVLVMYGLIALVHIWTGHNPFLGTYA